MDDVVFDADWIVTSWAEITNDLTCAGMEDRIEGQLVPIFRLGRMKGLKDEIASMMLDMIKSSEGWTLEDVTRTNRVSKQVFGCRLISLEQVQDILEDDC